jgi:hypothetical protein
VFGGLCVVFVVGVMGYLRWRWVDTHPGPRTLWRGGGVAGPELWQFTTERVGTVAIGGCFYTRPIGNISCKVTYK